MAPGGRRCGPPALAGLLLALVLMVACDDPPPPSPPPAAGAPAPRTEPPSDRLPSAAARGRIPFDFPVLTTSARAGDFVLAPPRKWVENGFRKGGERQALFFFGAWMVKPGPATSVVRTLLDQEQLLPNSLIIPIRRGQSARPGEVLLTAWASGSGMQRALVVRGGSRKRPRVRYLDMKYSNPAGIARRDDTLGPNTFHRLRGPWEPGTTLAIRQDQKLLRGIVVRVAGDRVLALGFAGRVRVVPRERCLPLPIAPRVKRGERVHVPLLGVYHPGLVQRVAGRIGRVFVTLEVEGEQRRLGVGFSNLLLALPAREAAPDAGPGAVPDARPRR